MRDAPGPVQDSSSSSSSDSESSQNSETEEEVLSTITAQLDFSTEPKTLNFAKSRPDWPE